PEIQEVLRHDGFPHYEAERIQQLSFGPKFEMETKRRWVLASADRQEAVVITEDFIVYETAKYDTFETFLAQMSKLLKVIQEKADISLVTRVGVRFVDYLRTIDKIAPRNLLSTSIRGLELPSIPHQSRNSLYMLIVKTT